MCIRSQEELHDINKNLYDLWIDYNAKNWTLNTKFKFQTASLSKLQHKQKFCLLQYSENELMTGFQLVSFKVIKTIFGDQRDVKLLIIDFEANQLAQKYFWRNF